MPSLSRRNAVQLILSGAAWIGLAPKNAFGNGFSSPLAPSPGDSDQTLALKWMRTLNTAQLTRKKTVGTYAELAELGSAPYFARSNRTMPEPPVDFEVLLRVAPDGSAYSCVLRNRVTGFAYRTTQGGLIYEGSSPALAQLSNASEWTFGFPLQAEMGPLPKGPVGRSFKAISEFFFPVLSASGCPLGVECGGCGGEHCELWCGATCCNWGTSGCVWCCTTSACC